MHQLPAVASLSRYHLRRPYGVPSSLEGLRVPLYVEPMYCYYVPTIINDEVLYTNMP